MWSPEVLTILHTNNRARNEKVASGGVRINGRKKDTPPRISIHVHRTPRSDYEIRCMRSSEGMPLKGLVYRRDGATHFA